MRLEHAILTIDEDPDLGKRKLYRPPSVLSKLSDWGVPLEPPTFWEGDAIPLGDP